MSNVTGVVDKLSAKALTKGKDLGRLSFSFKLVGDEKWYSTYTNNPNIVAGDSVSFVNVENGAFNNVDVKTIARGVANVNASSNATVVPVNSAAVVQPQAIYHKPHNAVQTAIQFQASRNAAIEALNLAISAGIKIPLPAKANEQLDSLLSLVDEITVRYNKATSEASESPGE